MQATGSDKSGKFPCMCGRSYKWKRDLTRHQRNECGKEPRYMCSVCPYKGKRKSHLTRHLLLKHKCLYE